MPENIAFLDKRVLPYFMESAFLKINQVFLFYFILHQILKSSEQFSGFWFYNWAQSFCKMIFSWSWCLKSLPLLFLWHVCMFLPICTHICWWTQILGGAHSESEATFPLEEYQGAPVQSWFILQNDNRLFTSQCLTQMCPG